MSGKDRKEDPSQVPQDAVHHCAICEKDVKLAGSNLNWKKHEDGKEHCDNVDKSRNGRARFGSRKITSFFTVSDRAKQSASVPGPSRIRPTDTKLGLLVSQNEAIDLFAVHGTTRNPRPQDVQACNDHGMLDRLRALAAMLPDSVPIGLENGELAAFATAPVYQSTDDYDSEWEFVDTTLNNLLGWGQTDDTVAEIITRGRTGIDGLLQWLETCLTWPGVTIALLEGKLERLCRALILCGAVDACRSAPSTEESVQIDVHSSIMPASPLPPPLSLQPPDSVTSVGQTHVLRPCQGYKLDLPDDESPYAAYPTLMHTRHNLPWDILFRKDGIFLISEDCHRTIPSRTSLSKLCLPCAALEEHHAVIGIERRARTGVHENTPWQYHSPGSMRILLQRKNCDIDALRFRVLSTQKSLIARGRTLDEHKRLVMAIASSDAHHRVHKIVAIAKRNGAGIHTIVSRLDQAIAQTYKVRSFDEAEYQRAFVILKLAGQRVADFMHRAFGTPSLSTIRRHLPSQPLRASPGMPTAAELDYNLSSYQLPASSNHAVVGLVIQVDETKLEKRLRWDPSTNMILGVCREHGARCSLEFTSLTEADVLSRLLSENEAHFATEVTVVAVAALSANHCEYSSWPFLLSGTCKSEDAATHRKLLQEALDAVDRKTFGSAAIPYCIASDGEARRGKALASMTLCSELSSSSALFPMLSPLPLFNRLVGREELTCDKDWAHVAVKQLRNTLVRRSGCSIDGCSFNRALLKRHLLDGGMSSRTADALLSPNDPQDVVLAFQLISAISHLPLVSEQSKPMYKETRRVLRLLGTIYNHILQAYTNVRSTLTEQLVHLSAIAHHVLALYLKDRGGFIPAILYLDLMLLIKNAYFCVAKTKRDNPDGSFWLILLGTDGLEKLFGIVRTMVGSDANADLLQMASRASGAAQVGLILREHPEWDNGPRHLHMRPLEDQGDDISSKVDHLNPSSWSGDVKVKHINLHTCWIIGRQQAEQELHDADISPPFDHLIHKALHATFPIDMLRPLGDGKLIYIGGFQQGDVEEEDFTSSECLPSSDCVDAAALQTSESIASCELLNDPDLEDLVSHEATLCTQPNSELHTEQEKPGAWIQIGDSSHPPKHKSSILRLLPSMSNLTAPESTNRLSRICGFTRYLNTAIVTDMCSASDELCLVIDDPALTLLDYDGMLFLAVIRILEIQQDNISMSTLPVSCLNEANIRVKFSVMSLSSTALPGQSAGSGLFDWEWNGRFEKRTNGPYIQDVEGSAVQVINPRVAPPSRQYGGSSTGHETYQFKTSELQAFGCELLGRNLVGWGKAPQSDSVTFPYRLASGVKDIATDAIGPFTVKPANG
ncbi:hypothetical protein NM688_g8173 [Phlebia brevispora]|uniref:Uncharacterized protein n=1 Tax=Phlebia brevispora TaxID=194682 RepID=A0ACC1RWB7_9APHY|nr:hypothetical protein NM688_g8173 [Phlebia brevispora]